MASTREIKERINSIRSTMKITNAMYMISSTKMNNARKALVETEPYFFTLQAMFTRVLRHLPEQFTHPFLDQRVTDDPAGLKRAIICITADKGLAGAYNHNVINLALDHMRPDSNDKLFTVGEVGRQYFLRHGVNVEGSFHYTAQKPTLSRARQISSLMLEMFGEKEIDEVYVVYTEMKNSMESEAKVMQLLPLIRLNEAPFMQQIYQMSGGIRETFNLEPDAKQLLNNIVPPYITGYIYSALVESYCAEHSARMQAMDSANKNGQELLSTLSTAYNRQRQAQITQEITEVVAGAKARHAQLANRKES